MGWISNLARELGTAYGTFQHSLTKARQTKRPGFLTAWAQSERWRGGDWTERNAQQRAIQNGWYFSAISVIVDEVIQAKFQVVSRKNVDQEPIQIPNHPLEQLIRRPNPFMGRAFLWEFSFWWLRLDGNFYWFVSCDDSGRPVELWPIPANDVTPIPGDAERFIDCYEYIVSGGVYHIPAEYVVHVRRPNPFNIFDGLSDLRAAMLPIDADTAMARWNGSFFGQDNVMPSSIINLSSGDPNQPINPADAEALKSDLRSSYQAWRRKTAVTTAYDVDVNLLGWNSKDMDFIAGRGFTKEEIWAITRVHAGVFDPNATEANATVAERRVKNTVWGDLTRIAEQLTVDLVIPFYGPEYEVQFEDIRITDRQLELQEMDRARGALTINEVRQRYYQEEPIGDDRGNTLYGQSAVFQSAPPLPPSFQLPGVSMMNYAGLNGLGDIQTDLRRWRNKAISAIKAGKPASVKFRPDVIDPESRQSIATLLHSATSLDQVKLIFQHAQETIKKTERPWRPWYILENKLLIALNGFSGEEAERLKRLITEEGPEILNDDAIWLEHEAQLSNEIAAHFEALARFGVNKVREAIGNQAPEIINWDLTNQNATEWSRQYAADLVGNITDTTRQRIRDQLAQWVESRETLDQLSDRIDGIINNSARARTIATTEATGIFAEANNQAWSAAGYATAIFRPGAHVNCRCYLQPAILPGGNKVMVWYTARDELVCREPIQAPWGEVEGCRGLHLVVVSDGPMLGEKLR